MTRWCRVLASSRSTVDYPFACAVVNISHLLLAVCRQYSAKVYPLLSMHLLRTPNESAAPLGQGGASQSPTNLLESYGQLFSAAFLKFHQFYQENNPGTVMKFNSIRDKFFKLLTKKAAAGPRKLARFLCLDITT